MKKITYSVAPGQWNEELVRLEAQLREGIITFVEINGKRKLITIIA